MQQNLAGFALVVLMFSSWPSLAGAQTDDIRYYPATVTAHVVGCVPFELSDDDDDEAAKAIEAARRSWRAAARSAGIKTVGFLFVLDQDSKRKKDTYPIVLSLCGTIEEKPSDPALLRVVTINETKGQIAYCPSRGVEECMNDIREKIPSAADELPVFPRYAYWTRQDPPSDGREAVDGLIGTLLPVEARLAGETASTQTENTEPQLRPLGEFKYEPCASKADGCPSAEGPGDPTAVLIFLPDPEQ